MSPAIETRQQTIPQLRSVDRKKRAVELIASDFSLDSYGTRIDPNGWDLEQFKKNPVICLQHDSYGHSASAGLPVANAIPETVRVENGKLLMTIRFPEAGKFPLADQVFELVADGFLRGVSVGFDPDMQAIETVEEVVDGKNVVVTIFRKQKLMETSLVTIPANGNGMVRRAKQLDREDKLDQYRRMTEEIERMAREAAAELEDDEEEDEEEEKTEEARAVACDVDECKGPDCETEGCACACHKEERAEEDEKKEDEEKEDEEGKVEKSATVTIRVADLPEFQAEVEKIRGQVEAMQADYDKYKAYFERKQPANRASTKVLDRFYNRILQEEIPKSEKAAWDRMGEAIEAMNPVEEEKQAAVADEKPAEEIKQEVEAAVAAVTPEVKPEEPNPASISVPAEEAPQPERKASVRITLSALRALPTALGKQIAEEAAEALRNGMPVKDLDGFLDERSKKLLQSLINHS